MKLRKTISKYHLWYLSQTSLQIMLLPIQICLQWLEPCFKAPDKTCSLCLYFFQFNLNTVSNTVYISGFEVFMLLAPTVHPIPGICFELPITPTLFLISLEVSSYRESTVTGIQGGIQNPRLSWISLCGAKCFEAEMTSN